MLTFLGFAMVITFMYLIMTKRLSALIALILVPILFALFGGFSAKIGPMMLEGISKLAPTGLVAWALFHFLQPVLVLEPLVVNTIVGPVMLDLVQEVVDEVDAVVVAFLQAEGQRLVGEGFFEEQQLASAGRFAQ